jgi:hypothetical protein
MAGFGADRRCERMGRFLLGGGRGRQEAVGTLSD